MSVSRKREYLADASGAQFTRNPLALAAALQKLAAATAPTRAITRGAAHLCIVDPSPGLLSERSGFLADVMSSHPPIDQRIDRLRAMAYLGAAPAAAGAGEARRLG
jgi:heat shock protein HtpX